MPTLILDKVDGAELEATRYMARYTRMGTVTDIDIVGTSDADALVNVMSAAGMPRFNDPLSASNPGLRLVRVRVIPQLEKFRRVRVALGYETLSADFTPTAYLLRDRTFTQSHESFFIPGTRTPVLIGFDGIDDQDKPLVLPPQPLMMVCDIAVRSLQLTTTQYGRPDGGAGEYGNYVNDDDWPSGDVTFGNSGISPTEVTGLTTKTARSRPMGYWKLNVYQTDWLPNQGIATVTAEAVTKNIEDWSIYSLLRHDKTGRYPFGSLSDNDKIVILATMSNRDYEHGIIYPQPNNFAGEGYRGIARVGPYPMTDFTQILPF